MDSQPGFPVDAEEEFRSRFRSAPLTFLALDYDGTLAPFHADPMQARPLEGVVGILGELKRLPKLTLAIVSGRPVKEVVQLLGIRDIPVVGAHGFERLMPDGTLRTREPDAVQKEGLEKARQAALEEGWGDRLEIKVASVAFHTRGIPSAKAAAMEKRMRTRWTTLASPHDLECRPFNGGVEIRASGWHKGEALGELLKELPEEALCVYIGDDDTDEDAFKALGDRGMGIKVGDVGETTAAKAFLRDCQAVREFLRTVLRAFSAAGNGPAGARDGRRKGKERS